MISTPLMPEDSDGLRFWMEPERVEVWLTRFEKLTGFETALLICVLRLRMELSHVVEFVDC